jgi:hypothetical protein
MRPRNLMRTRNARSVAIGSSCLDALCGQLRGDLRNPAGEIAGTEERHFNRVHGLTARSSLASCHRPAPRRLSARRRGLLLCTHSDGPGLDSRAAQRRFPRSPHDCGGQVEAHCGTVMSSCAREWDDSRLTTQVRPTLYRRPPSAPAA